MIVTVNIEINKPKESVWKVITDIEHSQSVISGIKRINLLNKPSSDLVGLKWEVTREMFGKEATETMWVTDAENNDYFCTRAESHGSVYITKLSLRNSGSGSLLTMSFNGIPQGFSAKILSLIMGPFIKSSIRKVLTKDLGDIKSYVEKS